MEIERRMRIEITTPGRQLEKLIGEQMLPYEKGLYVPTYATPVIRHGVKYRVVGNNGDDLTYSGETLAENPKLIVGDVFSEKNELVLPVRAVRLLTSTPYLPHRAFLLIQNIAERLLTNHFVYTKLKKEGLRDIIEAHIIKPTVQSDEADVRDAVFDEVIRIIQPVINHINEFMGKDHFHVHFQYLNGSDLVIEKSVDYRIHVFNEKVASGEWNV